VTAYIESLRGIADRLTEISRDICGSNRLLLQDEIERLRSVIHACEQPLKQALPVGFKRRRSA
jgi:hypothetical protein